MQSRPSRTVRKWSANKWTFGKSYPYLSYLLHTFRRLLIPGIQLWGKCGKKYLLSHLYRVHRNLTSNIAPEMEEEAFKPIIKMPHGLLPPRTYFKHSISNGCRNSYLGFGVLCTLLRTFRPHSTLLVDPFALSFYVFFFLFFS